MVPSELVGFPDAGDFSLKRGLQLPPLVLRQVLLVAQLKVLPDLLVLQDHGSSVHFRWMCSQHNLSFLMNHALKQFLSTHSLM